MLSSNGLFKSVGVYSGVHWCEGITVVSARVVQNPLELCVFLLLLLLLCGFQNSKENMPILTRCNEVNLC